MPMLARAYSAFIFWVSCSPAYLSTYSAHWATGPDKCLLISLTLHPIWDSTPPRLQLLYLGLGPGSPSTPDSAQVSCISLWTFWLHFPSSSNRDLYLSVTQGYFTHPSD